MRKSIVVLVLPSILFAAIVTAIASAAPATTPNQVFAHSPTVDAYLELSVDPPIVTPGALITLHIAYHNIGLPAMWIQIDPSNVVTYEPSLSIPCFCSAVTFRTLTTGVVTFTAIADGEIPNGYGGWYWGSASDNGPAIAIIADTIWRVFLPVIRR